MIRSIIFLVVLIPAISYSQSAEEFLLKAEEAQENNDYKEAIKFATKAIKLDSFNASYFEARGIIYAGLNVDNKRVEHIDSQSFKFRNVLLECIFEVYINKIEFQKFSSHLHHLLQY